MDMEHLLHIMRDMQEMVAPEDALTESLAAYSAEQSDLDVSELEQIAAAGGEADLETLLKKYGML